MTKQEQVKELHAAYQQLSGMDVQLRFNREASWVYFVQAGFTNADLRAVIQRLVKLVHSGDRRPECLKFSNVIEQLDRFEEELAMIKAEKIGIKTVEKAMTVFEIRAIMEAKTALASNLANSHAHEDAFGFTWDDDVARQKYVLLRHEIKNLQAKLSAFA